jgi:hypothetical protein
VYDEEKRPVMPSKSAFWVARIEAIEACKLRSIIAPSWVISSDPVASLTCIYVYNTYNHAYYTYIHACMHT